METSWAAIEETTNSTIEAEAEDNVVVEVVWAVGVVASTKT